MHKRVDRKIHRNSHTNHSKWSKQTKSKSRHKCYYCDYEGKQIQRVVDHSCSCHPNEILKVRSLELNATSGKQGFRTKDMHVIPAEILNGHNKILINNTASELIVIENAVDQNDIDENEEMEDLQESLLNLSVEMIQNLHESPYGKKSKTALHSVPSTKENSKQKNDKQTLMDCIPSVIDEMRKIGVLENWTSFNQMLARGEFPLNNIAFLLFMHVCNFCRKKILLPWDIRIKLNNFGGLDIGFSTGNGCDSWEVQNIEAGLLLAIRKKEILSQLKK